MAETANPAARALGPPKLPLTSVELMAEAAREEDLRRFAELYAREHQQPVPLFVQNTLDWMTIDADLLQAGAMDLLWDW